jgi:ribosome maturation factor RimP
LGGILTVDLHALIERTLEQQGFELVSLEVSGQSRLLRVFVDKSDGVNIDDCVSVSNQLTRVFEVEGVDYGRLEVSSPGLDRPLRKPADFERFKGSKAAITLRVPRDGRKRFVGMLDGVADGTLELVADGVRLSFSLGDIDKARLVPEV